MSGQRNGVQIVEEWKLGCPESTRLNTKETAALLRQKLKECFPGTRCTVKVTHPWYGWIRVAVRGEITPELCAFAKRFSLYRHREDDYYDQYVGVIDIDGVPTRIHNSVRWVEVEPAGTN